MPTGAPRTPDFAIDERRWRREARSAWLRVVVLGILSVKLVLWESGSTLIHAVVLGGYAAATFTSLTLALSKRTSNSIIAVFAIVDAALVIILFRDHLFAPEQTFDHRLSAPALAIGFILLAQVALRLKPWLVILFASIVLAGWLSLIAVALSASLWEGVAHEHDRTAVFVELALAAGFGFSALVCYLLTRDHESLLSAAVSTEKRRHNLARFFSPGVVADLETTSASLKLGRRRAAVMFIDLRSFSIASESMLPEEIADFLTEYRQLVTETVFTHKGTIDKFIGDGVMAVFGQPHSTPDDTARAFQCALDLVSALKTWNESRRKSDKLAMEAGIGLHVGPVVGGVLRSGTHDEFTVIGDTVNIAERLERISRMLGASIVVSEEVVAEVSRPSKDDPNWIWKEDAELEGRRSKMRVAYLPAAFRTGAASGCGNAPFSSPIH